MTFALGIRKVITLLLLLITLKKTGYSIKWDLFEILASGKTDYHCKVYETLFIEELQPALHASVKNVKIEKFLLY